MNAPLQMCFKDVGNYTLPEKKCNFNFRIFTSRVSGRGNIFGSVRHAGVFIYGDPGPGSVTLGCKNLNLAQILLIYAPPKKKGNLRKLAFLLGKSVLFNIFI